MSPSTMQVFVAYSHAIGTSSGGFGCAMLTLATKAGITSFQDLSDIAKLIKDASPELTYSNVFVTMFRIMPEIDDYQEVNWMITYAHGNQRVQGVGMLTTRLTGPFDLGSVIELIKRQGIENPVVINLQPLDL